MPTFVDKPFANDVKDADAMLALAQKHNAPLMSCSSLRYDPLVVEALKKRESLGSILSASAVGFVGGTGTANHFLAAMSIDAFTDVGRFKADMDAYVRTLRGLVGSFLRAYLPGSGSLWRIAARIQAPTLVIGGALDRLVDVRVAPQVARTVPDSRLLMLNGVGHVAQMEVPEIVARAVVAMLNEAVADVAR